MLSLSGISAEDVNAMISDALGVFPRICNNLSDVVYRKTNGNPYFALEFLRSLIDRDIINYSLREKHWKWDINQICAENITDNVLFILTNKMSVLEDDAQTALKVASCFGINISAVIARKLDATLQYQNFQATLDHVAVKEGFMDFDGMNYCFVHDKVIQHGEGLEDKSQYMLDSYSLLVSLFYLARKDLLQAFHTCIKVLNLLGEDLPLNGNVDNDELVSIVTKTKALFQEKSNDELMTIHNETSRRSRAIMQFYDQLSIVSYLAKPGVCPYFMARWAHFSLAHNVSCKYTPGAFVSFSLILSCEDLGENARIACRIGKIGIMVLSRNASTMGELPGVYLIHYVHAGSLIEPIQTCVSLMQHAYEIGMQTGNPSKAAFNLSAMVAKQIKAGTNLLALKRDIANYLKLAGQYAQKQLQCNLLMMNAMVLRLIGDEEEIVQTLQDEKDIPAWEECEFCLDMMTSFYLGHMERVYHKSKLWEELVDSVKKKMPPRVIYIAFFSGLASASLYSYGKKNSQRHLSKIAESLSVLENAATFSDIGAEEDVEIRAEFDSAILASRSSKFVHEEGLACELAGMHYKKNGNKSLALSFFRQARSCYESWGSCVKVRHMTRQIDFIGSN
ncbi:hypothetical protein HJC23_008903 [Cyclotella cryptica]|uniref:Uncharacterized protein n=1 Tax=Cyclotella cryptica TaxID=29204 RepID=A0ABD3NXA2_9STRA